MESDAGWDEGEEKRDALPKGKGLRVFWTRPKSWKPLSMLSSPSRSESSALKSSAVPLNLLIKFLSGLFFIIIIICVFSLMASSV